MGMISKITTFPDPSKMVSADTNWEALTLEAIAQKYDIRFDAELLAAFKDETFTVNPIEIQLLRELQNHNKGDK